jgi:DNA repair protein RadD
LIELRDYQTECLAAHWSYFQEHEGNPLFVVPTAGGKSHIIAEFLRLSLAAWPTTRAIVLTHVKELIEQNHDKVVRHMGALAPVGIYSAGIGRRDTDDPILFAGIQSMYQRAEELGWFDLVLVDECHLIPKRGEGRYRTYLDALREINPNVRVLGYTATHYRLDGGYLHKGDGRIFTDVAYEITIERLVKSDPPYLSELVAKQPLAGVIDTAGVHTATGDFKKDELEAAAMASEVEAAVDEMIRLATEQQRKYWLVFACGIDHARRVCEALTLRGVTNRLVIGTTKKAEREVIIDGFKRGSFTCLVNVGVLTTGFDAPLVDLLGLMRPTQSTGLYVQIMGRGMRLSPETGKRDCLVLDYGGNVERHGPVNRVKPKKKGNGEAMVVKVCPACQSYVAAACRTCPICGFEFPPPESHEAHDRTASDLKPMDWDAPKPRRLDVTSVFYRLHEKVGKPPSLRVDYLCGMRTFSEWICLQHGGYAQTKAERWWLGHTKDHTRPIPGTVLEALERKRELRCPASIDVIKEEADGKFERVVRCYWPEQSAEIDGGPEGARGTGGEGSTRPPGIFGRAER